MTDRQTLSVVVDLATTPLTFDIVHAVVNGAVEQRLRGYRRLEIIIVPPSSHDQRAKTHPFSSDHLRWRVRHLIVPTAGLVASPGGVTICPTRDHAADLIRRRGPHVYPDGCDISQPQELYWFSHIMARAEAGADVRVLEAPEAARSSMGTWLRTRAGGRKVVTVTLRETSYSDVRNSDVAAWTAFVRELDPDRYRPVVLRDLARVHEPLGEPWGVAVACPEAVLSVPLRLALYESADINLFVNNGPAALAYLNRRCRFAILKMLADVYEARAQHQLRLGVQPNTQYPFSAPDQLLVWEEDSVETIRHAFSQLDGTPPTERRPATSGFASRMRRSAMQWTCDRNLSEAEHDLRRLLVDNPGNARALAQLTTHLRAADRLGDAVRCAEQAASLAGNDPYVRRSIHDMAADCSSRAAQAQDSHLPTLESAARLAHADDNGSRSAARYLATVLDARAHRAMQSDNILAAHDCLDEAATLDPADPVRSALLLGAKAKGAREHLAGEKIDEALTLATEAVAINPHDPCGQDALAAVLAVIGGKPTPTLPTAAMAALTEFARCWLSSPGAKNPLVLDGLISFATDVADNGGTEDGLAEALLAGIRLQPHQFDRLAPDFGDLRSDLLARSGAAGPAVRLRRLAALAWQAQLQGHPWPTTKAELIEARRLSTSVPEQRHAATVVAASIENLLTAALFLPLDQVVGIPDNELLCLTADGVDVLLSAAQRKLSKP